MVVTAAPRWAPRKSSTADLRAASRSARSAAKVPRRARRQSTGDVVGSEGFEQADGEVAGGGHRAGCGPGMNGGGVLGEGVGEGDPATFLSTPTGPETPTVGRNPRRGILGGGMPWVNRRSKASSMTLRLPYSATRPHRATMPASTALHGAEHRSGKREALGNGCSILPGTKMAAGCTDPRPRPTAAER